MRYLKYFAIFLLGFFIAKFWFEKNETKHQQEEIQVVLNQIKSMSKLVVSEGTFSEIYNYSDAKKYFYDYLSFDKKAIVSVNAKVEVGYDLSKLEIQIDSIGKKIVINKIPKEAIVISPDIKYFDLQQSSFNSFTKDELNKINKKSIEKIKETIELTELKTKAKTRLFEELSKIYQLSVVYGWEVEDNTNSTILSGLKKSKAVFIH
ncbi:uncharacterized protein DUF4230 [Lutibacter sp. Hel_I_33_5]|nr:uncharacterized protein DUF4230 [Lutibacter sp. Hel_I_33_5]